MDSVVRAAIDSWQAPVASSATLLFFAALYTRGFYRLHLQMPERFPIWRLVSFLGGLAALWVAIGSPLKELDDVLLQVHMTQHLILMMVAPALLLAGAPAIAMVRGMPPPIAKVLLGPILRSSRVRHLFAYLTQPWLCWILFVAAIWAWHLPATFQLALRSEPWHAVEHACFFTTSLMFWYPVIQPWPSLSQWPRWAMLPYLLLADGQNTVLSALFMFSGRLFYPYYLTARHLADFTPMGDQILAGAIMWVPGSVFYLVPAALILFKMLAPQNLSRRAGSAKLRRLGREVPAA